MEDWPRRLEIESDLLKDRVNVHVRLWQDLAQCWPNLSEGKLGR